MQFQKKYNFAQIVHDLKKNFFLESNNLFYSVLEPCIVVTLLQ